MFLPKFLTKRKFLSLLVLCSLLFVLTARSVLAFSTPTVWSGYHTTFEQAVFQTDEMNLQSFVNESLKATISSMFDYFVGCITCTPEERQQYPGLLLSMANFTASIYATPPASGVGYLAYLSNKLGIVTPAYAQDQGTGFETLRVILPIWEAFRNLTYGLFVIVFVIIGFAIMFRVKISPQTVITIESALPKMIIALLLITFSYAIVGFMIDIMLVICLMLISIFDPLLESVPINILLEKNIPETIINSATGVIRSFYPGATITLEILPTYISSALILTIIGVVLMAIIGAALGAAGGAIASIWTGPGAAAGAGIGAAVGGILLPLIFVILLLIILIRCLWTLLKAFISVILATIFGPFMILAGTLPGSNAIRGWFMNLLGNLAVLPVMLALFLLASLFGLIGIAQLIVSILQQPGTTNAIQFGAALVLLGQMSFGEFLNFVMAAGTYQLISLVFPLIGLGILFMAPNAANMIQAFLSGKPFAWGTAIRESITGAGTGGLAAYPVAALGPRIRAAEIRGRELFPTGSTRETIFNLVQDIARGRITKGGR